MSVANGVILLALSCGIPQVPSKPASHLILSRFVSFCFVSSCPAPVDVDVELEVHARACVRACATTE